jgi:hypothetical protein
MRIVFCCLLIFFTVDLFAQPNYSGKYRLNLPVEWKKNAKILQQVSEVASLAFEEIKDKQLCLECDAPYVIELYSERIRIISQRYSEKSRSETYRTKTAFKDINGRVVPPKGPARSVAGVAATYQAYIEYSVYISLRLVNKDGVALKDLVLSPPDDIYIKNTDFTINAYNNPDTDSYPALRMESYVKQNRKTLFPNERDMLNQAEDILFSFEVIR